MSCGELDSALLQGCSGRTGLCIDSIRLTRSSNPRNVCVGIPHKYGQSRDFFHRILCDALDIGDMS